MSRQTRRFIQPRIRTTMVTVGAVLLSAPLIALASTSAASASANAVIPTSANPGTSLTTSLSGGGQNGASISVPPGTAVTGNATVSNGSSNQNETGTVTYNVYSDAACTNAVSAGSAETIVTPGTLPASQPVTLATPGVYYWQAVYSGDALNNGSLSTCGSDVETVSAGGPAILKVCKVAGPGVWVGESFAFTAGSRHFTVPAGRRRAVTASPCRDCTRRASTSPSPNSSRTRCRSLASRPPRRGGGSPATCPTASRRWPLAPG